MTRQPAIIPSRLIEGGQLATKKQDFVSHYEGGGYRHTADQIDMSPAILDLGGDTVQETLENIFQLFTNSGTGFVSVGHSGDGYDGYTAGDYNVTQYVNFKQALEAALADRRVLDGATILILPGIYHISSTIDLPPKVQIFGDAGGVFLVGETIEQPLFKIRSEENSVYIDSNITLTKQGYQHQEVKLTNLSFFDNLYGSSPNLTVTPFIEMETGSALSCYKVSFFGRMTNGASLNRQKTFCAIATTSGNSQGTSLSLEHCFIDGCKIAIKFTPGNGPEDYCHITNCKIRFFGKEDASYTVNHDTAFDITYCQCHIANNHVLGEGAFAKTFATFNNSSGDNEKCKIIISNNTGYCVNASSILIDNQSGKTLLTTVSSNNWNYHIHSSWQLSAGDGNLSIGDITGSDAIDLILKWSNLSNVITTLIINPGTYNVKLTSQISKNFSNVKLIGNKIGNKYPKLILDIEATDTDSLNQKYCVVGNYLSGLYITSSGEFQSIRPSFYAKTINTQDSAHLLEINDCIFFNVSLNISDPGSSFLDQDLNNSIATILIQNCTFIQDDTFNDSLSLNCPIVHQTIVNNCYFKGNGYCANFGNDNYVFSGLSRSNLILNNFIAHLNDLSISNSIPGNSTAAFFTVNDDNAKIKFENCQIMADLDFGDVSPINSSLLTSATIKNFIYILANEICVEDSVFHGPNQFFTLSSINYALPCVSMIPGSRLLFENNKIYSGSLPLQISGRLADTTTRSSIIVSNNDICHISNSKTITLMDIDLEPNSLTVLPNICFTNNNFLSQCTTHSATVYHSNVTESSYDTGAIVQIYCRGLSVNFSNNKIVGKIVEPSTNPYSNLSGLHINTYNSDAGNITYLTEAKICKNYIYISDNDFVSGSSSQGSSLAYIKSSYLTVSKNNCIFYNTASIAASLVTCMVLNAIAISSLGSAIVSQNIFSRYNLTGTAGELSNYIYIPSTTTISGQIINNQFTDYYVNNSSSATTISDNTSTVYNWRSEQNKNQTKELIIRGGSGNLGLKLTADTYYGAAGVIGSITASSADFLYNASTSVRFYFQDTSTDQTGIWSIHLHGLIPHGAYITKASVTVDVDSTPTTTSIATMYLKNYSTSINVSSSSLTTSGATLTLNPTINQMVSNPGQALTLELTMRCNSSARVAFTAGEISISYRW